MQLPTCMSELIALSKEGHQFEFVYFSNQDHYPDDEINRHCLSQWYPSTFQEHGKTFQCAAAYMMWRKAKLFGDETSANVIASALDLPTVKTAGRSISGFNEQLWEANKVGIVYDGNILKFSQNDRLREFLCSTDEAVLVEASVEDCIWGIGISEDEAKNAPVSNWPGENLLGFTLMEVRGR